MLKSVLLVALTALVAAAAAPAASATQQALVLRIVDTPEFLESTPECPAGRGVAQLRSPAGAVIGRAENCVLTSELSCGRSGCALIETASQRFVLREGTVDLDARLVYRFSDDFSFATHTITATVVGGTGRYAGASGFLAGAGVIRFDPDFTPHPSITEVLLLG